MSKVSLTTNLGEENPAWPVNGFLPLTPHHSFTFRGAEETIEGMLKAEVC